jgi:deoxyuridine 5'-triphosphate nucleotidohydrolase
MNKTYDSSGSVILGNDSQTETLNSSSLCGYDEPEAFTVMSGDSVEKLDSSAYVMGYEVVTDEEWVDVAIDCKVKFAKVNPLAQIPTKNNSCDTGFDVYSVEDKVVPARGSAVVDCGLEFADITPGFWVKVEGRSGLGFKHGIMPHPGIIDNGYRGSAGIKLYNLTDTDYQVSQGDKIAQFVVYRNYYTLMEEGEKTQSNRGEKGFGSSGK